MKAINLLANGNQLLNQKIISKTVCGISIFQENFFYGDKFKNTSQVVSSIIKKMLNEKTHVIHFCSEKFANDIGIFYYGMITGETVQNLKNENYNVKELTERDKNGLSRINVIPIKKDNKNDIENLMKEFHNKIGINKEILIFFDGVENIMEKTDLFKIKEHHFFKANSTIIFHNNKNEKRSYVIEKNTKNNYYKISNRGKEYLVHLDDFNNIHKAYVLKEENNLFNLDQNKEFDVCSPLDEYWNHMITGLGGNHLSYLLLMNENKKNNSSIDVIATRKDYKFEKFKKIDVSKMKVNIYDYLISLKKYCKNKNIDFSSFFTKEKMYELFEILLDRDLNKDSNKKDKDEINKMYEMLVKDEDFSELCNSYVFNLLENIKDFVFNEPEFLSDKSNIDFLSLFESNNFYLFDKENIERKNIRTFIHFLIVNKPILNKRKLFFNFNMNDFENQFSDFIGKYYFKKYILESSSKKGLITILSTNEDWSVDKLLKYPLTSVISHSLSFNQLSEFIGFEKIINGNSEVHINNKWILSKKNNITEKLAVRYSKEHFDSIIDYKEK